jgi:hypothetical protein
MHYLANEAAAQDKIGIPYASSPLTTPSSHSR